MFKKFICLIIIIIMSICLLNAQDESPTIEVETEIQSGIKVESLTKKGNAKKVLYREKVFDYFIEPFYQRNYFNVTPDVQVISTVNFYEKYQVTTELGFSYFLNNYMLFSDKYSAVNYEYENYTWQPCFIRNNYLGSYFMKFETLNDDDINTAVSFGRINPEYTPLTFKKKHNGLMCEIFDEETKLILTGAQLKNFNNTKKYLFSSRLETEKFGIGRLGVNFVNSWYDMKPDDKFKDTDYYHKRKAGGAALYLKFKDKTPWDREGSQLKNLKIEIKYDTSTNYIFLDEFTAGSVTETKYFFDVYGKSDYKGDVRYADFNGYFIYRIIIPENIKSIRITSEVAGDYAVEYSYDNKNYTLFDSNEGVIDTDLFQISSKEFFLMEDISAQTYVYLEIRDDTPVDGYGGDLYKIEYYEDGKLKTTFSPSDEQGSDDLKYLYKDFYSTYGVDNGVGHRFADGDQYFIYRFPVSSGTKNIKFRMLLKNDFKVCAYLDGFEDEANILHSAGQEKGGANEGYYEISLDSYQYIYDETYVSKSQKVIGVDYKFKLFDIDFYVEMNKFIDERIYANQDTKYKSQYAFITRAEKSIKKHKIKVSSKYYRIEPDYNLKNFVDDNDDEDQYKDDLEPFHVEKKYLNYDPNLDVYNYNKNFTEVYDDSPDYTYQWNINDISYLSCDQQGFDISFEKNKLFNMLKTELYYFKVNQISEEKTSDKIVYKLKYLEPVPGDSYLDNEYRLEYIKDNRDFSKNNNNLKNFFKCIYNYWGLRNINWQFGINQIYFNKNLDYQTADLTSEFLNSLKYTIHIIEKDFTIAPIYMVKFYRHFRYSPDYSFFIDLTQHFLGGDINYKFLKNFKSYFIYRVIYNDDKFRSTENNFLHIMELAIIHTGKWFFKTGCNYSAQNFIPENSQSRNWETFRIFGEVRSYF